MPTFRWHTPARQHTPRAVPSPWWFRGLLLAVLAGGSAVVAAAPLEPASLLEATWTNDPQWSPDGRRLVAVRTRVDGESDDYATDLWLHAAGRWRPLTSHPAADGAPRWSPDGRWLAFASSRSGSRQLWVLDMRQGGEPLQVTDFESGAGAYAWSPDSRYLAVLARRGNRGGGAAAATAPATDPYVTARLRTRQDGAPGWAPLDRNRLWVVDVLAAPRAPARAITSGDLEAGAPAWSGDGRWLLFSSAPERDGLQDPDSELFRVAVDGQSPPVRLTDRRGPDEGPLVSPDGRWVAWTGFDESNPPASHRTTRLYAARLDRLAADGQLQPVPLATGLDRSIGEGIGGDTAAPRGGGTRLQWCADSRCLRFTAADRGSSRLYEADLAGAHRLLSGFPAGDLREFSVSSRGELAALQADPATPARLRLARPGQWAAPDPAAAWSVLASDGFGETPPFQPYEEVNYPSFDGRSVQGWVLKPPGFDPARRWPLVLYIHGGPHSAYGATFFHEFQVLAAAGYVVLITNPRGSTSYGEEFANVIQYRYPGDDYRDLMAGVDLLLARGYIDPARLLVGGGSGGGLLTAWTVSQTDRFAAALVERAVTNWHSFVGTADLNRYFATRWFRDLPWRDTADYLARSPLQQVDKVRTPVFVIHSTDDYRTALDQGLQYYTALRLQGKPAKLAVFPQSAHGLSREGRPSQRVRRLELILEWFGEHAPGGGR